MQETWVQSLSQKIPWRRKWQPSPVFLSRKSHGGAWQTTVHKVAKSWTGLSVQTTVVHKCCFCFQLQTLKSRPAVQETRVQSLSWEDPLKKEMATYFSILA